MFRFILILFISSQVWAQKQEVIIPTYNSTDNTGKGKQERLNSIETQIMTLTTVVRKNQTSLSRELPSAEEFSEFLSQHKQIKEEFSSLKEQVQTLERSNRELQEKLTGVGPEQLGQALTFLRPLRRGEYKEMQREIQALKLTIRSMEAVIDSLKESP